MYVVVDRPGTEDERDAFYAATYIAAVRFIDRHYNKKALAQYSPHIVKVLDNGSRTTEI